MVSIVKGLGVFHIALSGSRGALRVAIILNPKPIVSGPRPPAAASSLMLGPRGSVLKHVWNICNLMYYSDFWNVSHGHYDKKWNIMKVIMTYVHLKRFGGLYLLLVTYVSDYMFVPTPLFGSSARWIAHCFAPILRRWVHLWSPWTAQWRQCCSVTLLLCSLQVLAPCSVLKREIKSAEVS